MVNEEAIRKSLRRYLPTDAVQPFWEYMQHYRIAFHITRSRHTKLGDYRLPTPAHSQHAISVNGDLNPAFFLWVLLHEMAHLDTFVRYGRSVRPHGREWQQAYALQLQHYLHCFPQEIQPLIVRYISSLPLSHPRKNDIERQLSLLGIEVGNSFPVLNELTAGSQFALRSHPERRFRAIEKRRTRWLCLCIDDGRKYLISGTAEVVIQ